MNSVEVYIVVEGPTEHTFVRDVLAPRMAMKGIVTEAIGIQVIRRKCPHFNNWLTRLEDLKKIIDREA